jgi:hypothetical protein
MLNRTHYCYRVESREQVSLDINLLMSLRELNKIGFQF